MPFWSQVHMLPLSGKQILKCQKIGKICACRSPHSMCSCKLPFKMDIFLGLYKEDKKCIMKRPILVPFFHFLHSSHKSQFSVKQFCRHVGRGDVHKTFLFSLNMLILNFKKGEQMLLGAKMPWVKILYKEFKI
jgi:hypothetical protein